MLVLAAIDVDAGAAVVQIRAQKTPIRFVHIGMVEIFLEVHPLTVGYFTWTIHQLAVVGRRQGHDEIQIRATEIEAMSVTNADKT